MVQKPIFALVLFLAFNLKAQDAQIMGFGGAGFELKKGQCLSENERTRIKEAIANNIDSLEKATVISRAKRANSPKFEWLLKSYLGSAYLNYYGISNYVDHNPNFPDQVTDFQCGARSYDLANGYNHKGTDIFLWPFPWLMSEKNQVDVVAASSGIIVYKENGHFDKNCSFNEMPWNAIYLRHEDGSVSWYGHLKNSTLTTKGIGDSVEEGEFLGVVGSSGSSTMPHLHFEVYDASGNLIDPYAGPCNNLNAESWWKNQKPYYEKRTNMLLTHSKPPEYPECPNIETINEKNFFYAGDTAVFAGYFQDLQFGDQVFFKIFKPDSTIFQEWTFTFTFNHLAASYWYWTFILPSDAACGEWSFEASLLGETSKYNFKVWYLDSPEEILILGSSSLCKNQCRDILAIPSGLSYEWSTGETTQGIEICASGQYYVTSTDQNNCNLYDEIIVMQDEPLSIFFSPLEPQCPGFVLELDVSSLRQDRYEWTKDGEFVSGESSIRITEPATYCVEAYDSSDCLMALGCVDVAEKRVVERSLIGNLQAVPNTEELYQLIPAPDQFSIIEWEINGGQIVEENHGSALVIWEDGIVQAELCAMEITYDGCVVKHCQIIHLLNTSTTDQRYHFVKKVYPVPAEQELYIELENDLNHVQVNVFNHTGQSVEQMNLTNPINKLDMISLAPGIYILIIQSAQYIQVFKIVKI
jgi:murein DD-endopeptidase MepM/ murein hydrolase activator NlpD